MRNTQCSQTGTLNNHQEKTHCQWNLSSPHEGWHTPTHIESQDRASLTVAHISSFTVNDSRCLCVLVGLKIPYGWIHLAVRWAATREANERVNGKKRGEKIYPFTLLLIHPNFPLPLCLLVFLSVSKPFIGSQAEWLSRAEQHRSWQTLTGAINWRRGVRYTRFAQRQVLPLSIHPSFCLPAAQWRKSVRRRERKGGRVRENISLNRSIIIAITYPYISLQGS